MALAGASFSAGIPTTSRNPPSPSTRTGSSSAGASPRWSGEHTTAARKRRPEAANAYLADAEFDAALAQLDLSIPDRPANPAPAKVVGARFDAPLREAMPSTMTETARDILRSLDLVRQIGGAAMTMIAGIPGTGKSEAVKHYAAANEEDCIYIQAVRAREPPGTSRTAFAGAGFPYRPESAGA